MSCGKTTRLVSPTAPTSPSTIESTYTVPSGKDALLGYAVIANHSGADREARIYVEDDGADTPGDVDLWFKGTVVDGDTRVVRLGDYPLPAGGIVHIWGASTSMSFRVVGKLRKE